MTNRRKPLFNMDTMKAIYRRMGGDGHDTRRWGIGKVRIRINGGGHVEKDGSPNATYRDVLWALEVIREYAESNRTGQPMRACPRAPVRYEVKVGRRGRD